MCANKAVPVHNRRFPRSKLIRRVEAVDDELGTWLMIFDTAMKESWDRTAYEKVEARVLTVWAIRRALDTARYMLLEDM